MTVIAHVPRSSAADHTVRQELFDMDAYWRAVNFLGAAQIYLRDNCLMERPLCPADVKPRLLGHWGTVPGINFIYTHLNRIIRRNNSQMMLVTGPGHGAPANLANLFLEGTLGEFDAELTRSRAGEAKLVRQFSVPGGHPSHLYPGTPGVIHEGGELGYALATAFGAVFDKPDLVVACIVGDGEFETGPTATAWHSTKFLNPRHDGAVLPILHLNGYKISCETVPGSMSDQELDDLFHGYGYMPYIVEARGETFDERYASHVEMASALDAAFSDIERIQHHARTGGAVGTQRWPMIVLRSPKGWTCPREVDGVKMEGSYRAHQVPITDLPANPAHLALLEHWLLSYLPSELFTANGEPIAEIVATCPTGDRRMGMCPAAYGGNRRVPLNLPDFHDYAVPVLERGGEICGDMSELGRYFRDLIARNREQANFRIFSPDELTSNRLSAVFEATTRQFARHTDPSDEFMGTSGRVVEMLSEHNCQGWLQGYLLTGRHGVFPCYEAFAPIVDSMMNQYAKFLKVSGEVKWRMPVASLTYLLTSEGWRQDHNGYSHQGPGFINNLLTKKARNTRVYLPPDTNCLLSTMDHCMTSTDKINLVIASKQPMPQWLPMQEAIEHCRVGASIWKWAGTDGGDWPDVVLAGAGVYPTAEVLAAAWLLRRDVPELRVRVVNVTDLLILEQCSYHPHGLSEAAFNDLFTVDRPVVFNFHGYPSAVKQLLFDRPGFSRFHVNGYLEEGSTTTPFDLLVQNRCSRFHLVIQAVFVAAQYNPAVAARAADIISRYRAKLAEHAVYIQENAVDMPEVTNWRWSEGRTC